MKLELGRTMGDCCISAEQPEKQKKSAKIYPSFYVTDIDLGKVDKALIGKDVTVTAKIRIREMTQRKTVSSDKKNKSNDSMDIEVISIDFGKTDKGFESLQGAIEDGLTEE